MKMITDLIIESTDEERCIIGNFRRFLHLKIQKIWKESPELAHKLDNIDTELYWLQKGVLKKS